MNLYNKVVKFFVTLMISFIAILLVISLGMPNFMESSVQGERFIAARVNGEVISVAEVSNLAENYIRQYYGGRAVSTQERNQLRQRVLEDMIFSNALNGFYEKMGMNLPDQAKIDAITKSLSERFPTFISPKSGRFDFIKFEREYLKRIGQSYEKISADIVKYEVSQNVEKTLNNLSIASEFDALEKLRYEKTSLSYDIVVIDQAAKDNQLNKNLLVSEDEIQARFKKDYLAKNKDAKLDKIIREDLEKLIQNDKKAAKEKEFNEALRKQIETKAAINQIAATFGGKLVSFNDVSLKDSLDSKKEKNATYVLSPLEGIDSFKIQRFHAELNKVLGPFSSGGNTYVVVIKNRKFPELASAEKLLKEKKSVKESLSETDQLLLQTLQDTIKQQHSRIILGGLYEKVKKNADVDRNATAFSINNNTAQQQ